MKNLNYHLHCGRRHQPKYHRSIVYIFTISILSVILTWFIQLGVAEIKTVFAEAKMSSSKSVLIANLQKDNQDLREENTKLVKLASLPVVEKMARMISFYFPEDTQTALAVFRHESGLNPERMNWNCKYGEKYTSCKPEDRDKAWSVDCGLTQINVIGQSCPKELFDPEINLQRARGKYDSSKWSPWVAYWNGAYKQSLDWAKNLMEKI